MDDFNIVKEEYLTLRREIETHLAETGAIERNCIFGIAAVYSWLAAKTEEISSIFLFIPVLIVFFGALRSVALGIHLKNLGAYILTIEDSMGDSTKGYKGWENFLITRKSTFKYVNPAITGMYWGVLLIVTLLVGFLF